ncbi:hypothetical protein [Flavihumibacter petaseus]|uniref:hypothetical protein n=1 Tax=Flavihumibacter petaseus TaxID=549295 RepID=UPI00061CF5FA|nr:hypothetical protein [Flavihumibacter petaseus]
MRGLLVGLILLATSCQHERPGDAFLKASQRLDNGDIAFLKKLQLEDSFIILSDSAECFFDREKRLIFSRLLISQASLDAAGYRDFDFTYVGDLSEARIS